MTQDGGRQGGADGAKVVGPRLVNRREGNDPRARLSHTRLRLETPSRAVIHRMRSGDVSACPSSYHTNDWYNRF